MYVYYSLHVGQGYSVKIYEVQLGKISLTNTSRKQCLLEMET